jgi:acyl-CoA synthetase (NDP forming)
MLMYMGPLAVRHEYGRQFAAAAEKYGKTAAAIINLSETDMRDIFQEKHIPVFDAATDACFKMLRGYIDYGRFLDRRKSAEQRPFKAPTLRPSAAKVLDGHRGGGILPPAATEELLKAYGFQCTAAKSATNLLDAKLAAAQLGYPVILKALVPDVAHRSDAGLVSRRIGDESELHSEYGRIEANGKALKTAPLAFSIDKYIGHDLEVILGVKYDATFGPVVLCGLGGVFAEVLKDYALRLAPLTRTDALELLASLKAYAVLSRAPRNIEALTEALIRLSDLALDLHGKIKAVDINPIVLGEGLSAPVVVDAKVHI